MVDKEALQSIEELHRLKTQGVISEEDFERSKERILHGPKRVSKASTSATPQILPLGWDGDLPAKDDIIAWMLLPLRRYVDFEGRSCRKEFWLFQLVPVALWVGWGVIFTSDWTYSGAGPFAIFATLVLLLGMIGLLVPMLAVQARRFHDQDKSGWFVLVNLIPYAGSLVVFILMLSEGTQGENRFGPDPLEEIRRQ